MADLGQTLFDGMALGAMYASLALALALVYRGTAVLNFAQGDIGMVMTFAFWTQLVAGIHWPLAIVGALLVGFLMAVIIERAILRPLQGEPLFTVVMATIGLAIVLQGVAGMFWGHSTVALNLIPGAVRFGGVTAQWSRIMAIVLALAMATIVLSFLRMSRTGLAMRATASEQDSARLMGIRIGRTHALIWALAAFVSFGAGISIAENRFLTTDLGDFILRVFPALILGGLDSVGGAVLGGFAVGIFTTVIASFLSPILGPWAQGIESLIAYLLTFLILMVRPYGFFGTVEIERV